MAFPFLRLPPEIRNMIYTLLFVTMQNKDRIVIPDPTRTRRKNELDAQTLNLQSLSFLRTCQIIHEEATTLLYGIHTFHFNDEPRGEEKLKVFELDLFTAHCDHTSMYAFLVTIQERNRLKIWHIHLSFSSADSVFYPNEALTHYGLKNYHRCGRAILLGNALELIADGHALQTLVVSLTARNECNTRLDPRLYPRWIMFFLYCPSLKLCRKLRAIAGVQKFVGPQESKDYHTCKSCDTIDHLKREEQMKFVRCWALEMKKGIEAPRPTTPKTFVPSLKTTFGYKSEPIAQKETTTGQTTLRGRP